MRRRTAAILLALLWRHLLIAPWAMLFAAYFLASAAAATPLTFVDGTASFGAAHRFSGQLQVDDWTFSLDGPATANASIISIALRVPPGISQQHEFQIDDAALLGDGLAVAFDRLPSTSGLQVLTLAPSYLHAGDYTIRVTGHVPYGVSSGSYAGTVNVSPIPEPGTWALLLAGLAAMAWRSIRATQGASGANHRRALTRTP